jgi:hypothetical protein
VDLVRANSVLEQAAQAVAVTDQERALAEAKEAGAAFKEGAAAALAEQQECPEPAQFATVHEANEASAATLFRLLIAATMLILVIGLSNDSNNK